MGDKSGVSSQVISLPRGGGALEGIGETFSPDLFTGTGNLTVPLPCHPVAPQLDHTTTVLPAHRPDFAGRVPTSCGTRAAEAVTIGGVFMETNVVRRGRRPGRYRSDAIPAAGLLGERGSLN